MADLRTRFATLDRLPAPDLWAEIERRAMATVPAGGDAQARGRWHASPARPWRGARPSLGRQRTRRLVLVLLGLALVLAGGLAVGIGSGLIRIPAVTTPVPSEVPPLDAGFALQPLHIEDFSAEVSIPATWSVTGDQCCDYQEFSGPAPEGRFRGRAA